MTQATELRELATLLDVSSGKVGIGLPSGTPSNALVISDGVRTSAAITAGTTALEIARTGGGDVGILINKDTSKWLIGVDNSDGNAGPLRFMYGAYNAAAHPGFGTAADGLNLAYDGAVGIGTKTPSDPLHVDTIHEVVARFESNSNNGTNLVIANADATTGRKAIINLAPANNVTGVLIGAEATEDFSSSAARTADLYFTTRANGILEEKVRILSNGDVGIGTNAPVHKLDVDGAIATRQVRHSIRPTLNLDFANSKELDSRITFYRDSIATYYDSKGILRYSNVNEPRFDHDPATGESKGLLIEESRTNLFTNYTPIIDTTSNDFYINHRRYDDVSPSGKYDATYVVDSLGTQYHWVGDTWSATSGTSYTVSFYAKAVRQTSITPEIAFQSPNPFATYTLTGDGSVSNTGNVTSTNIENVGNGWYRCSMSFTAVATTSATQLRIHLASTVTTYAGDGTHDILIWGHQVEVGGFPTSYIPSDTRFTSRSSVATYYDENGILRTAPANSARYGYKYDGRKWVETGLILESASTNYFTESNFFEGSSWSIGRQNISISKDSTGNPDGNTNTRFMTANSESGAWILKNVTLSSGTFYTTSVYAKQKSSGINVQIAPSTGFSPTYQNFNLSTGELGSGNLSNDQRATMEDVGNGWYRCSVTGQANSTLGRMAIAMTNGDLARLQSVPNGSMLYIFGTQMEANHGPTSFIYADSATKTRSADVASSVAYTRGNDIAEMLNVEYDIPQPVGTIYSEWSTSEPAGSFGGVFEIRDSGTNGIDHRFTSSNVQYYITDNTSINAGAAHTPNTFTKTSLAYDFDSNLDSRSARDGSLQSVNTSNIFNLHLKDIRFGSIDFNPAYQLNGHLKSFRLYPKRMTDGEIQALTENN